MTPRGLAALIDEMNQLLTEHEKEPLMILKKQTWVLSSQVVDDNGARRALSWSDELIKFCPQDQYPRSTVFVSA